MEGCQLKLILRGSSYGGERTIRYESRSRGPSICLESTHIIMLEDSRINYIELPAEDLASTKVFYQKVFGWVFQDFGKDYCAFNDGRLDGGFYRSPLNSDSDKGAALVVLYADDLEATLARITSAGSEICKPIFSFPGGRRFHFLDPNGNELAVWSDR